MGEFASNVINAFVAGRQVRQAQMANQRQQQLDAQAEEDRRLEREGLQLRLKAMKLEEKLRGRELALQNVNLLEGRPEADLTEGGVLPARAGVPGMEPTLVTPRRQVTIPGVDELGVESVTVQPQSMQEILAAKAAEDRRQFMQTPREIGGRLVVPEGAGGAPEVLYEPPKVEKDVTFRNEIKIVDGRRRDVLLGSDGNWYFPGDTKKPISEARVRPVPDKEPEPKATDDPALPRGVVDYLYSLSNEGLDFDTARRRVAETWQSLRKDHPRLDAKKVDDTLRSLFRPAPGSGTESMMDLLAAMAVGGGGPAPAVAAAPAQPPKPAPALAPQKPAAPASTPAATDTTTRPGAPKKGEVRLQLPDGRIVKFPSQKEADAFMKEAGFAVGP